MDYTPGAFNFKTCVISTNAGSYDILQLVVEFDVFYSIHSNSSAVLYIGDKTGLIDRLPIVGGEYVTMKYSVPTRDKEVSHVFRVQGVEGRQTQTDRTETYALTLVSVDSITNILNVVEYAYTNLITSDIVEAIYNDFLKPNQVYTKDIETVDSTDSVAYTGTLKGPLHTIEDLRKFAVSENSMVDYLFFEDSEKYNFKPLSYLVDQDPVDTFYVSEFGVSETSSENDVRDYQKIIAFTFVNHQNLTDKLLDGNLDVTVESYDPIYKTKVRYQKSQDNFDRVPHLGAINPKDMYDIDFSGNSHKRFVLGANSTNGSYSLNPYAASAIDSSSSESSDWQVKSPVLRSQYLADSLNYTAGFNQIGLDVTVPGNIEIEVGDIVNIMIPQTSVEDDFHKEYNVLFGSETTAKFIITEVKQKYIMAQQMLVTIIRCNKDTFAQLTYEGQR